MCINLYFDLSSCEYIAPQWFSELCPENNNGLSNEDYERIASNSSRYLRTPVFRPTGIACITALQMGMTREQLLKAGVTQNEYWEVFQPSEEYSDKSPYKWSDAEWKILDVIKEYMWGERSEYLAYDQKEHENMHAIIREWFKKQGLEIEE